MRCGICAPGICTLDPSVMVLIKPGPARREETTSLLSRTESLECLGMFSLQESRTNSFQLSPSSILWTMSDLKRPGNVHALIKATENYWFSIWGGDYALNWNRKKKSSNIQQNEAINSGWLKYLKWPQTNAFLPLPWGFKKSQEAKKESQMGRPGVLNKAIERNVASLLTLWLRVLSNSERGLLPGMCTNKLQTFGGSSSD